MIQKPPDGQGYLLWIKLQHETNIIIKILQENINHIINATFKF